MQTIYLDISNKGVIPTIHAKQGDVGRKFQVVLTDSGLPYIPVGGSAFSVWYSGASGEGNYTEVGDKSAFSVSGNKVTVEMISQMLSNDGEGVLSLVLNDPNGNQISTWNIHYICEYVPGAGSQEAKAYYTAFSQAVENLPYPDASLSASGKAADAAAVGDALKSKAPAGYGYGGTPKTGAAVFSNLSEMGLGLTASCTTEAFVKALKGHSNVQFMHNKDNAIRLTDAPFDYGTVEFHKGANDNYIYGIGVDIKGNIYVYKYHPSQTDTNGWYYDNPPMTDGVEYRTTERYNGRVVYRRLVNMGKLTAGGVTKVDVSLGSKIIRYAANNDWAGVPMDEGTGYEIRVKKVCPTYIEMVSGASNTNATAYVLVWYFK